MYRYRVYLRDKGNNTAYSQQSPALSERAINRRLKYSVALDSLDYPVSQDYISDLQKDSFPVVSTSRWMNTVVVSSPDTVSINTIKQKPYVAKIELVWINPGKSDKIAKKNVVKNKKFGVDSAEFFGKATNQNSLIGLEPLHRNGFRGEGIRIAVLDGGFKNVDTIHWFNNTKIFTYKDFIYPPSSIFSGHYHGTAVLSIMGVNEGLTFTGSAPDAEYCLLRTEDVTSEFPIEEDYWAAGAEYADSIGADIISSSLGYSKFDNGVRSYDINELNGNTAFISKVASIAAKKGILVVNSAGNDGETDWKKISFPADADGIISVGSVSSSNKKSSFSSFGPSSDNRVKPELVALGEGVNVVMGDGSLRSGSGTSFSAPIITGMAACLWQAFPDLKASELINTVLLNSDRYLQPDSLCGYGLPNAYKMWLALDFRSETEVNPVYSCRLDENSRSIHIAVFNADSNRIKYVLNDISGRKVTEGAFSGNNKYVYLSNLSPSVYIISLYKKNVLLYNEKILIR
jgi:subtilisin family serine protease